MKTQTRALQARPRIPADLGPTEFKKAADGDDVDVLDEIKQAVDGVAAAATAREKALTERLDAIEAKANRSALGQGGEPGSGGEAPGDIAAERKAVATFVRTGDDTEMKATSMSVGSDPDGGYLVMPALSAGMTKRLYDGTVMRRLARTEIIGSGDAFEEPLDLDEIGAEWVGEKSSRPATDTAQLGMLRVPLQEIYANQVVTQRLLDDSSYNIGGWVEGKIGDKFSRSEGQSFITGNGIKKPRGFLDYPVAATVDAERPWGTMQYLPSGHASAFATASSTVSPADALKDLMWSLRSPYRAGANWLMNSATAGRIDKFKNENGDYIWRDSSSAGTPPTLLGYPVEFDETMPDVAANALPIAFGNFKLGYLIVDRPGLKMLRDPYSSKPNVQFYAYRRVGGGLANSEAIKVLKIAET